MMKILGIVGSPRKNGNTHVLVSRILEGARDTGAETETVLLGELNIQECNGCHACWKGRHVCSRRDDMKTVYPKIAESDMLILGTPVYWYGPTAIMKCFIDRFVYFNCAVNRGKIEGKAAVIAVPFEDKMLETSDLVVGFFEKSLEYLQMRLVDRILVPGVTRRGEVGDRKRIMDRSYKLGQRLGTTGLHSPQCSGKEKHDHGCPI
jgi:putative NADPH-quinone reductase